jgi:putative nucleotidyltransferase with HDIG domain
VRLLYRVRQFWRTIFVKTDPLELERGLTLLNAGQAVLFLQLQTSEKVHALAMVNKLIEQGDNQPDLLVAAMLHDVGKLRYHLNPFERAIIVLVREVKPELLQKWGNLPSGGYDSLPSWRKPVVLAEMHAGWGAEMAQKCGVSSFTETLIREHHHQHVGSISDMENGLLQKLWIVDNDS